MRAIDPKSGAVLRKNATAVATGTVVVLVIIALGWALSKTRWRTAEIVSARVVEERTESDQAERVVEQGKRILANRRSRNSDFRVTGRGNETATDNSNVPPDPESERLLQETLRRVEEERRRIDDLAREADLSPLGQGLHQLGERSGTRESENGFQIQDVAQEPGVDTRASPVPNGIGRNALETADGQPIPLPADPPDVLWNGGRFAFGQPVTDTGTTGSQPERRDDMHRLFAGTVIPSILLTNVDSGLRGTVRAQVASDVRDSATGVHVVIPKGSFLFGRYGEAHGVHANRLFIGWDRIQFPNGVSVSPGNAVTSDLSGVAGVKGIRESRLLKALGSAFAINLLASLARREDDSAGQLGDAVRRALGDSAESISEKLLERDLNRLPTFRVSAGVPMNITLETDLWLPAY